MPYNEKINRRIEKMTAGWKNTDRKNMFGGVCHLLSGNMFCGVYKNFLILRLGEETARRVAAHPFVKPFDITGKPMKGWVMVEENGFRRDRQLSDWLQRAKTFAEKLPPKPGR
jgi:TfoX/Sxy family transcriptional regulator of competence genes